MTGRLCSSFVFKTANIFSQKGANSVADPGFYLIFCLIKSMSPSISTMDGDAEYKLSHRVYSTSSFFCQHQYHMLLYMYMPCIMCIQSISLTYCWLLILNLI